MKLGFGLPVCGAWAVPDIQLAVARRAEALDFHELWTIQRLLYAHAPRDEYYGNPGPEWPTVVAALIDGVDVVVVAVPGQVSGSVTSRLVARARQRGCVLVPYGRWDGADVTLHWSGRDAVAVPEAA